MGANESPAQKAYIVTGCFWPEAAPHHTLAERPLLVKADIQNCGFRNSQAEWLVCPPKQPFAKPLFASTFLAI
jgi:hypothetical protein